MAEDQIEQINKILSAPTGGTGDNMYDDAGAIDPREVGVDALNAGALTDEEFMMAEEFVNSLPPEDKPGFMELFIAKPREALNAVMDTLRQVFDREDAITGENFISYDSEGNATIGQPNPDRNDLREMVNNSGTNPDMYRGTSMSADYRPYPDTAEGRDEIRRRISMDMGQPAVARSGRDVNSPELDALLDRGAVERGRFQQQEIKPQNFGSLPSVLRSKGVSEKDIYKYLKVLDPSSPIREGEMSRSVVREGE
jgi:hypothetical protein